MKQVQTKGVITDYIESILLQNNNRILLQAGVSSGKSYMATESLPEKGNVLIITSRKIIKESIGNSAIRQTHAHQVTVLHIWDIQRDIHKYIGTNKFAFIVIDEIHFLLSDTYADAAVYMVDFIKSIPTDVRVIMMSACADRVKGFLEGDMGVKVDFVDLTKITRTVKPQKALTITARQSWAHLERASKDNKILYFAATTADAYELESKLRARGISAVAITSQPENRKTQDELGFQEEQSALRCLEYNTHWPDHVFVLITTSKLREGINLHDSTIKTVITELKDVVSLIQCSGRVRHGVEEFCVVTDKCKRIPYLDEDKLLKVEGVVSTMNRMVDLAFQAASNEDDANMLTGFDSVKKEYGDLIVRLDKHFTVNRGLIREYRLRKAEHRRYLEDADQYLSDVLGMPVYKTEVASATLDLLASYCEKQLTSYEKDELVSRLNQAGLNGTRLPVLLANTGYTYSHARNHSWYRIERVS